MRTENEIKKLKDDLEKLISKISIIDTSSKDYTFACNVSDALSWVLEEISTPAFLSDGYLNIEKLKRMTSKAEKEAISQIEKHIMEIIRDGALSLLVNGVEWELIDLLKKMNVLELGISAQKLEMILQKVLRKTSDPEVQQLLQFLQDNKKMLEKKTKEELRASGKDLKKTLKKYTDFVSNYADLNKVDVIQVGDDFFLQNLIGKQFMVLDVLEQDSFSPPVVNMILEVDGEKYLMRDENMTYVRHETDESVASLGKNMLDMRKYRQLPLKVSIEELDFGYKWKIVED